MSRYKYAELALLLAGTHPVYPGDPYPADATEAADQLNAKTIAQGNKDTLTGSELWKATNQVDLASLAADLRLEWLSFCAIETHDVSQDTEAFIEHVFGATSNTETAVRALAKKDKISPLQQLLGGVRNANEHHVKKARGELV